MPRGLRRQCCDKVTLEVATEIQIDAPRSFAYRNDFSFDEREPPRHRPNRWRLSGAKGPRRRLAPQARFLRARRGFKGKKRDRAGLLLPQRRDAREAAGREKAMRGFGIPGETEAKRTPAPAVGKSAVLVGCHGQPDQRLADGGDMTRPRAGGYGVAPEIEIGEPPEAPVRQADVACIGHRLDRDRRPMSGGAGVGSGGGLRPRGVGERRRQNDRRRGAERENRRGNE